MGLKIIEDLEKFISCLAHNLYFSKTCSIIIKLSEHSKNNKESLAYRRWEIAKDAIHAFISFHCLVDSSLEIKNKMTLLLKGRFFALIFALMEDAIEDMSLNYRGFNIDAKCKENEGSPHCRLLGTVFASGARRL